MATLLWSYTNPTQTILLNSRAGDAHRMAPGICAGAAARWCYKMLTIPDAKETCPEQSVAARLQVEYETLISTYLGSKIGGKAEPFPDLGPFFRAAGLRMIQGTKYKDEDCQEKGDWSVTSQIVRSYDGVYWYGPAGHAVGVARRGENALYYFEPEEGLYYCPDRIDFGKTMKARYAKKLNDKNWWIIPVQLASRRGVDV